MNKIKLQNLLILQMPKSLDLLNWLPNIQVRQAYLAILLVVGMLFSASASFARSPQYQSVCINWPEQRAELSNNVITQIQDDYALALKKQELWSNELARIDSEDPELWLKAQAVADILLLGAKTTVDTISIVTDLAGVSTDSLKDIDFQAVSQIVNMNTILGAESPEDAAAFLIGEKSNAFKRGLKALSIVDGLIEAQARFADRNETIALVADARKQFVANHEKATIELAEASERYDFLLETKNLLDAQCSRVVEDAAKCVSIKDYVNDEGQKEARLINQCDRAVRAFWCISSHTQTNQKPCGGKNFYRKQALLKAGEVKSNRYSLPHGHSFWLGGCYGDGNSAVYSPQGNYYCRSSR